MLTYKYYFCSSLVARLFQISRKVAMATATTPARLRPTMMVASMAVEGKKEKTPNDVQDSRVDHILAMPDIHIGVFC
jgi:hypothetical protein